MVLMAASMAFGALYDHLALRWSLPDAMNRHEGAVGSRTYYFRPDWILKVLLLESIDLVPTSITGRVLLGTWMVVSLILTSAYQGILTSLLAVPMVEVPVDSLQDLLDYGKIPWSVEHGTSIHQLLDEENSEVYKMINSKVFYIKSSFDEKDRMKEKRFAILCDFFSMKMIMSDDYGQTGECNYYIAKEAIWSASMAFAFPKGSNLTSHFNKWIMAMKESGLVNRRLWAAARNATACLVPPGQEAGSKTSSVLSVLDLGGVFLVGVGGMASSIFLFLMEKLVNCQRIRSRPP
ncbi:glutamate receptor 1-like [Penaeus chinensis]|uniref:glutamate receptor 1-like n=1 Tax=Penaeus chinensis TaxID=139456 RepID=UPI001FB6B1AC|nr:glutamate receptor 1-like [Penaeus chinensis]